MVGVVGVVSLRVWGLERDMGLRVPWVGGLAREGLTAAAGGHNERRRGPGPPELSHFVGAGAITALVGAGTTGSSSPMGTGGKVDEAAPGSAGV